ncbi:MAG: alanine racemase [Pseudomonadota bacterium]
MGVAQAHLEIDLRAIVANYEWLRHAAPAAKMAAVVKADGYGLGAAAIVESLLQAGCTTFFVSRLEEGIELRQLFDEPEIFVLDGLTGIDSRDVLEFGLVPVLNHEGDLEAWTKAARQANKSLPAAVHWDTGMSRLGFSRRALDRLGEQAWRGLKARYVMSHLACAETPGHEMNSLQRDRLLAIGQHFRDVPLSLANSAGVMLGADYQFGLCRPGIALFGGNPVPSMPNPLRPVVRLMASVLQIHEIETPGSVGYGATYATRPGMRLATLGLGYGDGLLRAASNALSLELDGIALPIAGRISMDLLSLDITKLPAGRLAPGDWMPVIQGPGGIDRWSRAADTIPYELLTRLGTRLKRHYIPPL